MSIFAKKKKESKNIPTTVEIVFKKQTINEASEYDKPTSFNAAR